MNENIFQIARQQVDLVKSVLGKRFAFEDNNTNEAQSGYTTYGTLETPTALIVVRLSNHICSMNNWTIRYKPKLIANNKLARRMERNLQLPYKERCFFSVVFKAFDYTPNDIGNWKAICREYVFNPLEIEKSGTIGNICKDCLKLDSNDNITINGQNPIDRIAKKSNNTKNNKEINDKGMNKKQTIRLNESQLQYIIGESIKKILSESFDNSEKTLYAYDCDNPNGYKVIHTVNGTDFREIKAYIQKFLSEQIDWMDDEHLNDKDIDGAITNIAKSLVKKGESGFIYTYCFYLGNDVPKNN